MKTYYHAHELAYQQIKSKGYIGWGDATNLAELGSTKTNDFLNDALKNYFPSTTNLSALDLGCGTGTTAFILAKHGFNTMAIDISETAIDMGRELALQQNLDIQFVAGDVLDLTALKQKFDLIYDSHFLHCIVFDEDRRRVFNEIKNALNPPGLFILNTMALPDKQVDTTDMFATGRLDSDFILWHKTKSSDERGVVEVNGQHWRAQRRIYPVETLMGEIASAGFSVIEKKVDTDDQHNIPSMLRLVLTA